MRLAVALNETSFFKYLFIDIPIAMVENLKNVASTFQFYFKKRTEKKSFQKDVLPRQRFKKFSP